MINALSKLTDEFQILQTVTQDYLNFEDKVMGIEVLKVMTSK